MSLLASIFFVKQYPTLQAEARLSLAEFEAVGLTMAIRACEAARLLQPAQTDPS